jgi:hypothetical protein
MPPQRSVVLDPEFGQRERGEPVRITLTGDSKLDNPPRDKFCFVIPGTGGSLSLAQAVSNALRMASRCSGSKAKEWRAGLGIVSYRRVEQSRPASGCATN